MTDQERIANVIEYKINMFVKDLTAERKDFTLKEQGNLADIIAEEIVRRVPREKEDLNRGYNQVLCDFYNKAIREFMEALGKEKGL